jgi:glucoamylase
MEEQLYTQRLAPAPSSIHPTWAPSNKDAVGTALGASRVWFTVAEGIITEVYYPRVDIPQLKDLGFIVANGTDFWVELRRLNNYTVTWHDDVIPAITIIHHHARFMLALKICVDPERDVLLIDFMLKGDTNLQLYLLAAPRIGEDATSNQAWADEWEGHSLLWAEQGPFGMALIAVDREGRPALLQRSVGSVGESDGWQDFKHNNAMTWHYAQAGPGEVALTAQLPCAGTLAMGLASSRQAAATLALQSLSSGFETLWAEYCQGWRQWLKTLHWPTELEALLEPKCLTLLYRSAAVIKIHEDRTFPGAFIASLSVPWGETSNSRGGYHLVWSRDLVETAGALFALGDIANVQRSLIYLMSTQQADGHWLQNQWLGGKPFWQGIQLDETAFPVLLASALTDRNALAEVQVCDMVRSALGFIIREGPTTAQDRWEEDPGINTFTAAVAIAALVEGSRFLKERERDCALMLADTWNFRLEEYTWVTNTALAKQLGVSGYYMRSAPKDILIDEGAKYEHLLIKNRSNNPGIAADEQLAIDCLQLVRFGLRAADDPAMISSLKAIDLLLKTDTPYGPVWHRYNGDGYGEHPDGTPFNGWGKGRGWPLLTGERGHMALLSGDDALPYLHSMAQMTSKGGLLPEQVWDSEPLPEHNLYPGQPNGSATPLVWAHAEFIKLALSIVVGEPVDRPVHTWRRYKGRPVELDFALWQPRQRVKQLVAGQELRILLSEPAQVHWGKNGWRDLADVTTEDWGLGYVARLPTAALTADEHIDFTFYWLDRNVWQDENFRVDVIRK